MLASRRLLSAVAAAGFLVFASSGASAAICCGQAAGQGRAEIVEPSASRGESRVALVVGNADYSADSANPGGVPDLVNSINDARDVRDMLLGLGFRVVYGEDLPKREMERAMAQFAGIARESVVAITYFAGHGATFDGTPYLVPTDAEFESLDTVTYELVSTEAYIAELRRATGVRLALIDACRDNAKEQQLKRSDANGAEMRGGTPTRGLARVEHADGLIIAYATQFLTTAADGAGDNSPFVTALVEHLPTPGIDLRQALFAVADDVVRRSGGSQRPEVSVSLFTPFVLVPAPQRQPEPPQPPGPDAELVLWNRIAGSLDIADFDSYLRLFPSGRFAGDARAQIALLTPAPPTPRPDTPARIVGTVPVCTPASATAPIEQRQTAIAACRIAVAANPTPPANYQLGMALYDDQQYEAAADYLQVAVAGGHALAQAQLGYMYDLGLGVRPSDADAARLYRLAAVQGIASAQANLGIMYRDGLGVPQDGAEAVRWFRLAVEKGSPQGQVNLGLMYSRGSGGLTADPAEAARLYGLAAAQGHALAQANLGVLYRDGRGVAQSDVEAVRLFRLAVAQGNATGQASLADMYSKGRGGLTQDYDEAARLHLLASNAGNIFSHNALGILYKAGTGVPQSDVEAVRFFRLAATAGLAAGQHNLAQMYEDGRGVSKDRDEAIRLYRLAAAQGLEVSERRLSVLLGTTAQPPR